VEALVEPMKCEDFISSSFVDNVILRFMRHDDIENLRTLCTDWFPIKYPDSWYKEIMNNAQYFSLAAVHNEQTIGVIVAEVRHCSKAHKEDADILGYWYPSDTQVAYILILGAAKEYRRKGVASMLLNSFIQHVRSIENQRCKAVYLHVLSTNISAVMFYERKDFKRHKLLPMYYVINGSRMDGYCYVYYVNNGSPPWTVLDVLRKCAHVLAQSSVCHLSRYALSFICIVPNKLLLDRYSIRMIRQI